MNFLKQYWIIAAVFILISLFVLIRTFSQSNFRYDAVKWAEPSALGTNIVTEDQIPSDGDEILLIYLGPDTAANIRVQDKTMKMNPESILEKSNLSLIRKNKGPVVLYSADNSVPARIWMILSEMGIKNIYILQDDSLNKE
jgi:hypothetical protein